MIVELFTEAKARRLFARALRPTTLKGANGRSTKTPGEERVVFCGVNWEQYERSNKSGYDGPAHKSRLFRGLDVDLLERCLALRTWRAARSTFRQSLRQRRR